MREEAYARHTGVFLVLEGATSISCVQFKGYLARKYGAFARTQVRARGFLGYVPYVCPHLSAGKNLFGN